MFNAAHAQVFPSTIVKVRYSADGAKIYAISTTGLFVSIDDGNSFQQSPDPNCVPGSTPTSAHAFTDLVVDPNNHDVAYVGVTGEGVYKVTGGGAACDHGLSPPLANPAPPNASTITYVALAISNVNSVLYAAFAGVPLPGDPGADDFENIDATSTATWPAWQTPVPAFASYGLQSQGGHDWALGTDPSGTTLLLGGIALYRGTGCGLTHQCTAFVRSGDDITNPPLFPGHHDYHSITWSSSTGWVYVANDGGLFLSTDDGATWQAQANSFGVANEKSVSVSTDKIFTSAWDVGAAYSTDLGSSFHGDQLVSGDQDGFQAVADPGIGSPYGYICHPDIAPFRFAWDGSVWGQIDNPPVRSAAPCVLAKGQYGDLFTTGNGTNGDPTFDTVLHSSDHGASWNFYQTSLLAGPAWSLLATNEYPVPTVYAFSGTNQLTTSVNGQPWGLAINPLPPDYAFGGLNLNQPAAAAVDWLTSDIHITAYWTPTGASTVVLKSSAATHGATWISLTGTAAGAPGRLKSDEIVQTIGVDSSSRAVIIGTQGTGATSVYGDASIWRLNNPDVVDTYHHWRPWVNGLPAARQPITWISGQYEAGVFYYYISTWGRGIWKTRGAWG